MPREPEEEIEEERACAQRLHTLAVAAAAAVAVIGRTGPQSRRTRPFDLKLSHWVPPSHPLQKALEDWGDSVEKASGGTIKFKVFPSQQLGKAFDHYDMARDGIADVTYINPGYQPGRFPIIGAGESAVPDVATPRAARRRSMPGTANTPATEMKDVKFCLAFVHDPGSFHSRTKKIMVPADIKGMKIRPAHATMAPFVTCSAAPTCSRARPRCATSSRRAWPTP